MQTLYSYVISGLTVRSDVELRAALPSGDVAQPDLSIFRVTPEQMQCAAPAGAYRLDLAGVGAFSVREGHEIRYAPAPGVEAVDLAIYLIGTCFAAALMQRCHVVLHGSAVSAGGRAMLFCGASGAGKSTLAAVLSAHGYPLLNDDVCTLVQGADGTVFVRPDGRMLKLWADALEHLQREPQGDPIRTGFDKFYAAPVQAESREQPVGAIFLLELTPDQTSPNLLRLNTAESVLALHHVSYRHELVQALGQQRTYLQMAAALCRQCPVYRLSRPRDMTRTPEVLDLLRTAWATSEVPASR